MTDNSSPPHDRPVKIDWRRLYLSPLRILWTVVLAIFVGETVVMYVIAEMPAMNVFLKAILDGALLMIVISPALFYLFILPVTRDERSQGIHTPVEVQPALSERQWPDKTRAPHAAAATRFGWFRMPHSPLRILGTIALAVFIGETLVMFILAVLPAMDIIPEAFVDSSLLIIIISPALFYFLFLPIIRHVRGRERAEADLRKNRDLLQTVFNGISEPLILLDEQLHVQMINAAAKSYFQMENRPAIDQPCHQALMCSDRPCQECDIPETLKHENHLVFERKGIFNPNRIEQVVIYRSLNSPDCSGATIIRITDVTEARILEKQVNQRERMASLGLLISGVAHEINNPNTFISFNLPILKEYLEQVLPILDDYARRQSDFEISSMTYEEFRRDLFKIMENIVHGSHRIDTIVNKLKEFSRIQDTRTISRVHLKTVLDRVVALADSQIKRMVQRFELEVPAELPEVHTDSQAIEQIILNLLINACQAADKNNSWVSLEASLNPDPPYALCIDVSDNGSGMPEDTLKHIFDPLFTTKGPNEGTGLGLYICHNLAEGLGGKIEVESIPGQGSTFHLMLPDLKKKHRPA